VSIQTVTAYRVGEQVFPTIQQAQKEELAKLLDGVTVDKMLDAIVAHTDEIVAILTCTPKSKGPRKPRSDIGKKRASRSEIATQT
jgi:hypothetical protein